MMSFDFWGRRLCLVKKKCEGRGGRWKMARFMASFLPEVYLGHGGRWINLRH